MTVNASPPSAFTIAKIVRLAYRRATLISDYQNPTEVQYDHAKDLLEMMSTHSETKGLLARVVDFHEITLVEGTTLYDMESDVLDVVSTAMFIASGLTDPANGELITAPQTREEWQSLSAKAAEGPPTLYFCDRTTDTVRVRIWPVPSSLEAGGRIRFQTHRFRASMRDGTKTPDFEQYWSTWLVAQLACDLAIDNAAPMERIQMLQALAQAAFSECRIYSAERPPMHMSLHHPTGWSN